MNKNTKRVIKTSESVQWVLTGAILITFSIWTYNNINNIELQYYIYSYFAISTFFLFRFLIRMKFIADIVVEDKYSLDKKMPLITHNTWGLVIFFLCWSISGVITMFSAYSQLIPEVIRFMESY